MAHPRRLVRPRLYRKSFGRCAYGPTGFNDTAVSSPLRVKFRIEDLVLPPPQDERLCLNVRYLSADRKTPAPHVLQASLCPAIAHRMQPADAHSV